jgi:hypothetical protein
MKSDIFTMSDSMEYVVRDIQILFLVSSSLKNTDLMYGRAEIIFVQNVRDIISAIFALK